jgi:hypothetical protein
MLAAVTSILRRFEMEYTNRADLLIAAGESIKMQEAAGIEPRFKVMGKIRNPYELSFMGSPEDYEFPLAVVEGRPVFVGDMLYGTHSGMMYVISADSNVRDILESRTWTPPKPKTVTIELLREDAEAFVDTLTRGRISEAIHKALETQK